MEQIAGLAGFLATASHWLAHYGGITVFFAVLFTGEVSALTFFLLAAQGVMNPLSVFAGVFWAVFLSDCFWFGVGILSRRFPALHRHYEKRISLRIRGLFENFFGKHMIRSMTLMKFMYGMRLWNLVWLGFKRLEIFEFVYYDLVSVLAYTCVLAFAGLLIGRGVGSLLSVAQIAVAASLTVAVLLLLYEGVRAYVTRSL